MRKFCINRTLSLSVRIGAEQYNSHRCCILFDHRYWFVIIHWTSIVIIYQMLHMTSLLLLRNVGFNVHYSSFLRHYHTTWICIYWLFIASLLLLNLQHGSWSLHCYYLYRAIKSYWLRRRQNIHTTHKYILVASSLSLPHDTGLFITSLLSLPYDTELFIIPLSLSSYDTELFIT